MSIHEEEIMNIMSITGKILRESTKTVLKEAVIEAVTKKADLREADLRGANLRRADLRGADLWGADLREADLWEADLNIEDIVQIHLFDLPDNLTLELMRWDCALLPDGKNRFSAWKKGKGLPCPFNDTTINRMFNFSEKHNLWLYGKPKMNIGELFRALMKSQKIKI